MGQEIYNLMILRAFLDYFPHSFYVKLYEKDSKDNFAGGQFFRVSRVKAEHYGLTIQQILGKTDFDLLPVEEAERALVDDLWVMENKKAIKNRREKITHSNGETVWVSATKMPFNSDGAILGLIGFSIDITEQVKAEERAESVISSVEEIFAKLLTALPFIANLGPEHIELSRALAEILKSIDNFVIINTSIPE